MEHDAAVERHRGGIDGAVVNCRIAVHLEVGRSSFGKIELSIHASLDRLAEVEVAAERDALVPMLVHARHEGARHLQAERLHRS